MIIYIFFLPLQVKYHLRFTYSPRNAPTKEKSELNPNNDLDWHTLSLFPLFQLPGPREQHDSHGGTPGKLRYPHYGVEGHTNDHIILCLIAVGTNALCCLK